MLVALAIATPLLLQQQLLTKVAPKSIFQHLQD
jgi:hypothetical protein